MFQQIILINHNITIQKLLCKLFFFVKISCLPCNLNELVWVNVGHLYKTKHGVYRVDKALDKLKVFRSPDTLHLLGAHGCELFVIIIDTKIFSMKLFANILGRRL